MGHGVELQRLQTALQAAADRALLILAKIVAGLAREQPIDRVQVLAGCLAGVGGVSGGAARSQVRGVLTELGRHHFHRQNMIHQPCGNGAADNAVIPGGSRCLGHGHATILLDGLETQGAIGASAGEEDAHGVLALVGSQRAEKLIDGRALAAGLHGRGLHVQHTASDSQGSIRRDNVDVVRCDWRRRRDLSDGHPGVLCQQLWQEALAVGGEVLDKHEGHSTVQRELREEHFEGLQATRGRPHADNNTARLRPPLQVRRLGLFRSVGAL